ncbi:MAG: DUF6807 domain-containing protein [Armatimonadota bacterium]
MRLSTGHHERKLCPVLLPESGNAVLWTVTVGDRQLIGQQLDGSAVYAMLPDAPAGVELPVTLAEVASTAPIVMLEDDGEGTVTIRIGGEPFCEYHYAGAGNRPFLYPVLGPNGARITRGYPMTDLPGDSADHPHQRSLWTAHGDVNGYNDWAEGQDCARIEHRAFARLESGPVFGRLVELLDWTAPDGRKLLRERREIRFYHTPADERLFDWEVMLTADEGPVWLGDTKEGGILAVRVATSMEGRYGGVIENGWGARGEAECWGKRAPWCDYSGQTDGVHAGIALFDWPGNPGSPTPWHVRDYGLMTANPFGLHDFTGDPTHRGDRAIQPAAQLVFKYRVYIHAGDASQAQVGARYLDYACPPTILTA